MKSVEELLLTWQRSTRVMHISHHCAAARYSKYHRWFGSLVSGLSAIVASSIFIAILEDENKSTYIIAAIISLITAVLTAVNSSLKLDGQAQLHHQAATNFQGLRRGIEEELVNCRNSKQKENYDHIRKRWTEVLESSPPLPQDIHDRVKRNIESKHKE